MFPNAVGKPLRRTLFRSRIWGPSLVRAALLGSVSQTGEREFTGSWIDDEGRDGSLIRGTYAAAVKAVAAAAGPGCGSTTSGTRTPHGSSTTASRRTWCNG